MAAHRKSYLLGTSLLLATILGIGLFAAWFFCIAMAENIVRPYLARTASKQLVFTKEGEALVRNYPAGFQADVDPIYQSLDGALVRPPDPLEILEDYAETIPAETNPAVPINNWTMRMVGFAALSPTKTYWYLIHDLAPDGTANFVGYDARTRQRVGYFGRHGFSIERPAAADSFQIPFGSFMQGAWKARGGMRVGEQPNYESRRENIFLVSAGELLKINLSDQTVESMSLPDKVVSLAEYTPNSASEGSVRTRAETRLVVRLPSELRFFSFQGESLGSIPLEAGIRDKSLSLRQLSSGELILQAWSNDDRFSPTELTWFGPDGKEIRRQTEQIEETPRKDPWGDWVFVALVPVPLVFAATLPLSAYSDVSRGAAPDMRTAYADLISRFWLPYTVLILVCLALAIWTYRRHLRYESQGAAAWAVFVLLLGPLGLAAYLLHRSWPVRTACERCDRPTPRDRSHCLACQQAFPAPELRGIEVFA